ncbi:MAG TPA: type 4a pilus biogenesis protein PilO [Candidatus Polarisedimenticolaceae bacterium]|nr:type 4a pilus biogenesis protein PilO [Candidatus Polarisedimenticolaceae bacterium]
MLERLPFWGQVLTMLLLAAGLVGLAYYAYPNLKQKGEEIQTIRAELDDMHAKINEGHAIEQKLPEFEQEVASLQRKLGDIQQILPTDTETGDLLRWIKNMSDQSNLGLKTFAPGNLKPVDFYKEFPIEMDVVGRYHDLGIFLDRVAKYSRIINVDNLRMSALPNGGDKTIRATFTATTFVYDDKAASGEAKQ